MNRRKVLSAIGLGALSAPVAVCSSSFASPVDGLRGVSGAFVGGAESTQASNAARPWQRAAKAFLNPAIKEAVRARLYEQCRDVTMLDPDLACSRALSLAAKITFQRQRNVERELARMESENGWYGAWDIIDKATFGRQP